MSPSIMSHKEDITVLIVDDEKNVRAAMTELLHTHLPFVKIVGEAGSIPEAVREIHQHNPNLVFLDIEMPGYTGLQLLEFFNSKEITFDIIFVTAFNEYAIQAFKIAAFDYLLKPVDPIELKRSVNRYMESKHTPRLEERVNLLREAYTNNLAPSQLAVPSLSGIDFIRLENIILLEASGTYTKVVQASGQALVASKPLGEFETVLQNNLKFFRPHRSFIINMDFIKQLSSKDGDIIIMRNEMQVPLSRYRKAEFEKLISSYKV